MAFTGDGMWLSAMAAMLAYAEDQGLDFDLELVNKTKFITTTISKTVPDTNGLADLPGVTKVRATPSLVIEIQSGLVSNRYRWVIGTDTALVLSGRTTNLNPTNPPRDPDMRMEMDISILGDALRNFCKEQEEIDREEFEREYQANYADDPIDD